jgi:hypothetical protein
LQVPDEINLPRWPGVTGLHSVQVAGLPPQVTQSVVSLLQAAKKDDHKI